AGSPPRSGCRSRPRSNPRPEPETGRRRRASQMRPGRPGSFRSNRRGAMTEFRDRVAMVAGASGALGSALVVRLASTGARVAAVDRDTARLDSALRAAGLAPGERLTLHGVDLADAGAVEALVAGVVARQGRLDHLFNVAGTFGMAESVEAT